MGFANEVSIHPARFLVCISKTNATYPVALEAERLAVHAIPREQLGLAKLFGGETGDDVDKFTRCSWQPAAGDATPLLSDCPTWLLGTIRDRVDFGDHVGHVLEPGESHDGPEAEYLTVRDLADLVPGHTP